MNPAIKESDSVNNQIYSCLNLNKPKSFFLFAGAGSGKTRSLVEVLKKFKKENINRLRLNGKKIAIITYTNAASDEIKRRLEYDPTFIVSTIHSFSWELIKPYQKDIKEWILENTLNEITELEILLKKGRAGTKAASDRSAKIESKNKRISNLEYISAFSYNPNGLNNKKESLNHSEVIKITSEFLLNKPLMQHIIISKYPILLIDESQDTKKELIDAFFSIQKNNPQKLALGLFGDTMQRIYTDGKTDLGENIPDDWETPAKIYNFRSPGRIINLINKIRSDVDSQKQLPFKTEEGIVRFFIVDSNIDRNKQELEKKLFKEMSKITSDDLWNKEVKVLTLEHHMAARRSGFIDFFEPLYKSSSDSTSLLDGSMSGIPFLINQVLVLVRAYQSGDEFKTAQIIKRNSPLLDKKYLQTCDNQVKQLNEAFLAVQKFMSLWKHEDEPRILEVIKCIDELNLFVLPENLAIIAKRTDKSFEDSNEDVKLDKLNKVMDAWDEALKAPFSQLGKYADYISDNSLFGTHQGIKGLQYPRVLVVLDDEEARGFLFSYEKLFGAKELTSTDRKNIEDGRETSNDRTRRLFYVTCSRAEESLAIVAYTKNPKNVKEFVLKNGWFENNEIVVWH